MEDSFQHVVKSIIQADCSALEHAHEIEIMKQWKIRYFKQLYIDKYFNKKKILWDSSFKCITEILFHKSEFSLLILTHNVLLSKESRCL